MKFLIFLAVAYVSFVFCASSWTLGGLFNVFNVDGTSNPLQAQHLAAFLLAIKEINQNNTYFKDISFDYVIRSGYGTGGGYLAADEILNANQNVIAAVTALPDSETIGASTEFSYNEVVSISSNATTVDLTDGSEYPYNFAINPLKTYEGLGLKSFFCNSFTLQIIIFVTDDEPYLSKMRQLLEDNLCSITVPAVYLIETWQTDFSTEILAALEEETTSFLLLLSPSHMQLFLPEAYSLGLQRFGSTFYLDPESLSYSLLSQIPQIDEILYGAFSGQYESNGPIEFTTRGNAFLTAWVSQTSTLNNCSRAVDITGRYVYYANGSFASNQCVGLEFSSFSNLSQFAENVANTYDAVYTIAYGLKFLVENNIEISGKTLQSALLNNVSFTGASGLVEFSLGDSTNFQKGNRLQGYATSIMNYHTGLGFLRCSGWSVFEGVAGFPYPCYGNCDYDFIYNTVDGNLANGYPPYALSTAPSVIKVAGIFNIYDDNGNPNIEQMEALAGFMLALNIVNSKNDGSYDNILPNSQIKCLVMIGSDYLSLLSVANSLQDSYFGVGVLGVVSALDDTDAIDTDSVFTVQKVVQVNSVTRATSLGKPSSYFDKYV